MSLLSWLLPRKKPLLSLEQQQRLQQLAPAPALSEAPLRTQRWVVVDLETSGLNLNRDQVLSMGAVVIEDGAIDLGQAFERTLQRPDSALNPSILLHGLGPAAIAAGSDPVDALLDFMEFVGDSPVLAFHAPFDQHMLGRALERQPGVSLTAPVHGRGGPGADAVPARRQRDAGLDHWVRHFNLQVEDRHNASADALATAELALILFSRARAQHLDSPLALQQRLNQWQRRKQMHSF
jgi:DNA polymerase III subunit epsilon